MLERADWLNAARRRLISDGVAAVSIDRLARDLKVTRGGFYYRFASRAELLAALIEDWRDRSGGALWEALRGPGDPIKNFRALAGSIQEGRDFSPAYETAMRAWARVSPKVARIVRSVDRERIEAFQHLFIVAGHTELDAVVRARVFYRHQVGVWELHGADRSNLCPTADQRVWEFLTGLGLRDSVARTG